MPQLNLTLTLDLSDDEAAAAADTLGCNPADLAQNLQPYAPAALREYAEMLLGPYIGRSL